MIAVAPRRHSTGARGRHGTRDRLPYHVEGINTTDGLEGLILEVCDLSDGSYSLKARLIAQKIG